jgi:nucleoside-diphosphate-sugar epimerase
LKVLLTGAAGFIGATVARELLGEGHLVQGLDNLNDAYDVRLKDWRLARLREHERFSFRVCDITDLPSLSHYWLALGPFDAVINLAARAGVRDSLLDPWVYLDTNARGTLNLLDLCRRHGTSKFVLASSSSVYGGSRDLPYRESQTLGTPLSPYAASKIAAEGLAHSYHHLYGLDVSVLRYFTVYGPAGRPDMSPFRFVRWIAEGEPVRIFGDGSQSRDYTYVDDIARGTIAALRPVGFAAINLGSDSPVSLLEMASCVERIVGREAIYEMRPAAEADVKATWADVSDARRLLGWEPSTPLREGLELTWRWYEENRKWARAIEIEDGSERIGRSSHK